MNVILIILCIVGLIYFYNQRKKIDEEERIALQTPGTADMLRNNFGTLVDLVLSDPDKHIIFERNYDQSIKVGSNRSSEILIMTYLMGFHGPEVRVCVVQYNQVIKEWKLNRGESQEALYREIEMYF